jgi:LysR family transcriptional regulator, glycine cleavage system transcriptional activator
MFEAVARLGSTVAAATELHLTHGAVSRRVRALEDHLGVPLLDRGRGGRLVPTDAGVRFAEAARQALSALAEAAEAASGRKARLNTVRINTTASFAALWLLPRLPRFLSSHPAFGIWVSESQSLIEPGAASGIDIAIRTGDGKWPRVRAERLIDDILFPVCAPAMAVRLQDYVDLAQATLLHDDDPFASWPDWTQAVGLGKPDWAARGPRLASTLLLIQAAAAGNGVALVPARLAAAHLKDGSLVIPFMVKFARKLTHWLVRPQREISSPAIRAFCAWIRAEALNNSRESRSAGR